MYSSPPSSPSASASASARRRSTANTAAAALALEMRRLSSAAAEGRTDEVRLALRSGMNAGLSECGGLTLLHKAAFHGDVETMRALLEQGSLLNMRDEKGQTPLFVAAMQLHPAAVQLLLWRRADTMVADLEGITPARAAAAQYHTQLAADGAAASNLALCLDHLTKTYTKKLEAFRSRRSGRSAATVSLVQSPAEEASMKPLSELPPDGPVFFGRLRQEEDIQGEGRQRRIGTVFGLPTPMEALTYKAIAASRPGVPMPRHGPSGPDFLKAARRGDVTLIRELLRGRAEVDQADSIGHTALHVAAEAMQPAMVQFLLQQRADALQLDDAGVAPLHCAVSSLHSNRIDGRRAAMTLDALLRAEEQAMQTLCRGAEMPEVKELPFFKNFEEEPSAAGHLVVATAAEALTPHTALVS